MATTDANGIAFAETTDPVSPLQTLLNLLQQSTSDALTNLGYFAQSAAPTHRPGRRWLDTDTGQMFVSIGGAWQGVPTLSVANLGLSAGMAVPITTHTPITFNVEHIKVGALTHSTTVNPGRVTVLTAGLYEVSFSGACTISAGGSRNIYFANNAVMATGTSIFSGTLLPNSTTFAIWTSASAIIQCAVNDVLSVYTNGPAAGTIDAGSKMQVKYLGPA